MLKEEFLNEVKIKLDEKLKAVRKERIYNSIYGACALMILCLLVFWADGTPIMSFAGVPIAGIVGWIAMYVMFSLINKKKLCSSWCTAECMVKDKYFISSVDNSISDERIRSIDCDRYNILLENDEFSCVTSQEIYDNIEVGQKYLFVFSGKKVKKNKYLNRNYILHFSKI